MVSKAVCQTFAAVDIFPNNSFKTAKNYIWIAQGAFLHFYGTQNNNKRQEGGGGMGKF